MPSIDHTILVVVVRLTYSSDFQTYWEMNLLLALGSINASIPIVDSCITYKLSINQASSIWGSVSKSLIVSMVAL